MKHSVSILLLILAFTCVTAAGVEPYTSEPSGEFMTQWMLCGPFALEESAVETLHLPGFEKDFLSSAGGELAPVVKDGQLLTHEGQHATWRAYESPTDVISLDTALGKDAFVVGYAYTEIMVDKATMAFLDFSTNDGGCGWLNGEKIWDFQEPRGLQKGVTLLPVALKQGRNTLLFKIEERGGNWEFYAKLLPFDMDIVEKRFILFSTEVTLDGTARLRFNYAPSAIDMLLKDTAMTLRGTTPEREIWTRKWNRKVSMPIELPSNTFDNYLLDIKLTLADDSVMPVSLPFQAGKRTEHLLFEDAKTDYAIVLPETASESEQWAAKELQHWLKEISGAELPIVAEAASDKVIHIGYSNAAAACLPGVDKAPELLDESFLYGNNGPTLAIIGGAQRGTMYGVMTLLEQEFGVRFYTPKVTHVPKKTRYAFDKLYRHEAPGLRVRNDFYFEAFDPIWAAHNKMNGRMSYNPALKQPGHVESYWAVHTFYPFMSPDEFFADHPEYFSLIDGERIWERAQLCLTNPNVLRIITERLLAKIKAEPHHLIYSVSQNDWRNPCQCANCQAIAIREESEAGPLIWFVNQVAEAVEKEHPDKFVGTLAYQYTRKAPKNIKPRDNVVIRLCSIECCFTHDFHGCPENLLFVEDLEAWSSIAPHMYIWDYVVNFGHYLAPFPNFAVLQPNIRTLRDNNAIGIMEQAAYQSRCGEFAELRAYVISRLLWNPECEVDPVIDDFMYGYYGRAGQYVREYFDMLQAIPGDDIHLHIFDTPDPTIYNDAFMRKAEAIFDKAETVAENDIIRQRVETARIPIMYLKGMFTPVTAKYDGTYQRFSEIVEREGIRHFSERGAPHIEAYHKSVAAAK